MHSPAEELDNAESAPLSAYQPPRVRPLGSVHDLLAMGKTNQLDCGPFERGNDTDCGPP